MLTSNNSYMHAFVKVFMKFNTLRDIMHRLHVQNMQNLHSTNGYISFLKAADRNIDTSHFPQKS